MLNFKIHSYTHTLIHSYTHTLIHSYKVILSVFLYIFVSSSITVSGQENTGYHLVNIYAKYPLSSKQDVVNYISYKDKSIKNTVSKELNSVLKGMKIELKRSINSIPINTKLRKNIRTKKMVTLKNDASLFYQIKIYSYQPKEKIVELISKLAFVERIIEEIEPIATSNPNDNLFNSVGSHYFSHASGQWYLKTIEIDKAWRYTLGKSAIKIAVHDNFKQGSTNNYEHEDYKNNTSTTSITDNGNYYGINHPDNYINHGTITSSFIAANYNNTFGVAGALPISNIELKYWSISYLDSLVYNANPPDIINMSWFRQYYSTQLADILDDALNRGIILVAGAGNDLDAQFGGIAQKKLPFAYVASNNAGRVIGVAATGLQFDTTKYYNGAPYTYTQNHPTLREYVMDTEARYGAADQYISGPSLDPWNYSLSINDIQDNTPGLTDSFIDVAASGLQVQGIDVRYSYSAYRYYLGTSFSAPLVSSVVALMLSVNPDLTPNDVYSILTRTTDRTVALPSGEQLNNLNDGTGRIYDRFTGFGRVNAMKAVIESMPTLQTITSSITLTNSHYKVPNTITVESGAIVTIPAGTKIFLGQDVQIVFKPGSKLIVQGNAQNKVEFNRLYENLQWKGIWLQGNSNSINYAVFDGGKHQLMIQAANNTITHCSFKNGWRGIDSYANQSTPGTRSSINTFSDNKIENMSSTGIMLYNTDATTIIESTSNQVSTAGLYLWNSNVYALNSNKFSNNSYGILITYGGNLSVQEFNTNNDITNNSTGFQASGSVAHWLGDDMFEGQNAFKSNTSYDIKAQSGAYILAKYNYFYPSAKISGNVDFTPTLTSDPGNNAGASFQMNGKNERIAQSFDDKMASLVSKIFENSSHSEKSLLLLVAMNHSVKKDDKVKSEKIMKELRKIAKESINKLNSSLIERANLLVLIEENEEMVTENSLIDLEAVRQKVTKVDIKNELDQFEISALIRLQKEDKALEKIDKMLASQSKIGELEIQALRELKEVVETQMELNPKFNEGTNKLFEKNNKVAENDIVSSITTYPNPFNPTSVLKLNLKENSNLTIRIYDLVGRLVSTLHSGELTKGEHSFRIDASNWSSGLYLYSIQNGSTYLSGKLTVIK